MEIEDLSTESIKAYLEKRETEEKKNWTEVVLEELDANKIHGHKHHTSWGNSLEITFKQGDKTLIGSGTFTESLCKLLSKYDGYFWLSVDKGHTVLEITFPKEVPSYETAREVLY